MWECRTHGVAHGTEETILSYIGDYLLRSWDPVDIPGSVQPRLIQHSPVLLNDGTAQSLPWPGLLVMKGTAGRSQQPMRHLELSSLVCLSFGNHAPCGAYLQVKDV